MKTLLRGALLGLLGVGTAAAATLDDGERCLAASDVPCAVQVVQELGAAESTDPAQLSLAGRTAFFAGDFPTAADLLGKAVKSGWTDRFRQAELAAQTRDVHADFSEARRGSHVVVYRPGVDVVLIDDAFEVMDLAERNLTEPLGGPTPGDLRLELYPDGSSFVVASSLPEQAVLTTGVVAISKWSRLLVTSPRARGGGYPWQDTVAHEYIHLVVAYHTHDRAPVWLQEGIAKYLEARWHDGKDKFRLDPRQEGLLAVALASDGLVTFEEMHPSLALLPSPERAALAYAQLATMIAFAFDKGGEDVLTRVLPLVDMGTDPRDALAEGAGYSKFSKFEEDWKAWVHGLGLVGKKVAELPTVLDGGDAMDTDPLLAKRKDLRRFVRLGDLLRERDRPKAALVEYGKAMVDDEPPSPLLAVRMAQTFLLLDDVDAAQRALVESLRDYPEFALSHKVLGEIRTRQKLPRAALEAYAAAAAINPFDVEVVTALRDIAAALGDDAGANRYGRYTRILRRGGEG